MNPGAGMDVYVVCCECSDNHVNMFIIIIIRTTIIIIIIITSVMELGHLLTRSGLTYPEVSSKVYHDSFCPLGSSVLITLGNLFRGILFTCCTQLLLYSSNFFKIGVIFNSFAICAFVS